MDIVNNQGIPRPSFSPTLIFGNITPNATKPDSQTFRSDTDFINSTDKDKKNVRNVVVPHHYPQSDPILSTPTSSRPLPENFHVNTSHAEVASETPTVLRSDLHSAFSKTNTESSILNDTRTPLLTAIVNSTVEPFFRKGLRDQIEKPTIFTTFVSPSHNLSKQSTMETIQHSLNTHKKVSDTENETISGGGFDGNAGSDHSSSDGRVNESDLPPGVSASIIIYDDASSDMESGAAIEPNDRITIQNETKDSVSP
jgi:hypothetical protein